jgi:hypothetical protein
MHLLICCALGIFGEYADVCICAYNTTSVFAAAQVCVAEKKAEPATDQGAQVADDEKRGGARAFVGDDDFYFKRGEGVRMRVCVECVPLCYARLSRIRGMLLYVVRYLLLAGGARAFDSASNDDWSAQAKRGRAHRVHSTITPTF